MTARLTRLRAFTLVELMVVIAVIGALLGLLLPALSGVQKRSRKSTEMNNLRHVFYAWQMYANHNSDAALPGYLEEAVQAPPVQGVSRGWAVRYQFADRSYIPLNNSNITGPWTWRLLQYVDYVPSLVQHYENTTSAAGLPDIDQNSVMLYVTGTNPTPQQIQRAKAMGEAPAFGYNGYYLGGWWTMAAINGVQSPVHKFYDHCGNDGRALTIPTTIAQIRRSSEIITFCAAAKLTNAQPFYSKLPPDTPGWHIVTPPKLADQQQWQPYSGDVAGAVEVVAPQAYVPLARHTRSVAVTYADGRCESQGYNAIAQPFTWISATTERNYTHAPCP